MYLINLTQISSWICFQLTDYVLTFFIPMEGWHSPPNSPFFTFTEARSIPSSLLVNNHIFIENFIHSKLLSAGLFIILHIHVWTVKEITLFWLSLFKEQQLVGSLFLVFVLSLELLPLGVKQKRSHSCIAYIFTQVAGKYYCIIYIYKNLVIQKQMELLNSTVTEEEGKVKNGI